MDLLLLNRAHEIAFLAHNETGETRGGMGNLPYYIHVVQVAGMFLETAQHLPPAFFGPYSLEQVAAAAVLHDVPEDCHENWTSIDIKNLDQGVYDLALMLKNGHMEVPMYGTLPRAEKKALDFAKMADPARVHRAVIPIKYKDRLHNLKTSTHWKKDRQIRYALTETPELLKVLDARMREYPNPAVLAIADLLKKELEDAMEEVRKRCE
jgi:(p)ppGpp synthase/HD superfamily hydrolase